MKSLPEFINEMLKSHDADIVIKQIKKEFEKYGNIEITNKGHKKKKYREGLEITLIKVPLKLFESKEKEKFEKRWDALGWTLVGYGTGKSADDESFWCTFNESDISKFNENGEEFVIGVVEPKTTQDMTDYIYNDCGGIIYHVTLQTRIESIKKSGFRLKNKSGGRKFEPRIYFTAAPDPKTLKKRIAKIYSRKNYDKEMTWNDYHVRDNEDWYAEVLVIDLNKLNYKIKVYDDYIDDYGKNGAFYTYDMIPPNTITDTLTYKTILNNSRK